MADKAVREITKLNHVLERLSVEYVPIDSLRPNSYNPNRQSKADFDLLLASMREDGFTTPIVALRESRTIVDGEHRWRAAGALGATEVPVAFVDMTEAQARISTLRHNRARGSEDMELAAEVLRDLERLGALDWAQDSLMLDDMELERILADVPAAEALAGEEFGEAWEPVRTADPESEYAGADAVWTETEIRGAAAVTASTPAALTAMRDREARLQDARTEQEREAIVRETRSFWRVSFLFDGEDATFMRGTLGAASSPAETVLALVREAVAAGRLPGPSGAAAAAEPEPAPEAVA